jgi:D-alanyl-D-alanine carboxypeptidase (penicillin-binding protein 5/6)
MIPRARFVPVPWSVFLIAAALLLPALPIQAQQQVPIPSPPDLVARGYLLVDHDSGAILAESNADERLEPASLTKIMSAYVVFHELKEGNLSLDDEVLISEKAWRTGGSKMFVEVGKRVSVSDLLHGMIVQSGNDASVALAEHIAGTEETFAELMNSHAKRLGMNNTHFVNSDGLPDPEHYTTPRDILKVTAATIREFPEYYAWYALPDFTFNAIKQANRNRLLTQDPSVDGVKTGHTKAAGYCLVASAVRDGQRLTSVVMGTNSESDRARDSLALLNYGYRFFETHQPYSGGEPLEQVRIWSGDTTELPVGPARDLFVTIPRGKYAELSAELQPAGNINAPVAWGDVVGEIIFKLGDTEIKREPAVALKDVDEGGILRRALDAVLQLF